MPPGGEGAGRPDRALHPAAPRPADDKPTTAQLSIPRRPVHACRRVASVLLVVLACFYSLNRVQFRPFLRALGGSPQLDAVDSSNLASADPTAAAIQPATRAPRPPMSAVTPPPPPPQALSILYLPSSEAADQSMRLPKLLWRSSKPFQSETEQLDRRRARELAASPSPGVSPSPHASPSPSEPSPHASPSSAPSPSPGSSHSRVCVSPCACFGDADITAAG